MKILNNTINTLKKRICFINGKHVLFSIIAVSIFLGNGLSIVFCAAQNPRIIINGKASNLSSDLIIQNDRVFVPLTTLGQELGYDVKWDGDRRELVVTKYPAEYPQNMYHFNGSDLEGIQLFALNSEKPSNELTEFILSVNGVNKVFNWVGQNKDRQPIISLINNDNHIAIVTNTASGSGIHGQKLYVVNKKSLEEIPTINISEYLKKYVKFTSDNKSFTMSANGDIWSLPYNYLDKSIMDKWAKEDNRLNDLESYYKYMIERAVTYQSYYKANNEHIACLIAVKNEYGEEQQAIGVFQFDYTFNGCSYTISKMSFTKYDTLEKLNKRIIDWDTDM